MSCTNRQKELFDASISHNRHVCYNCFENITGGVQAGIRMYNGGINFCEYFCTLKCLRSFINTPHIYRPNIEEHFITKTFIYVPTWEIEQDGAYDYETFLSERGINLLGPAYPPRVIERQNIIYTSVSEVIRNIGHRKI